MKTYKIVLRLGHYETDIIKIEAENWEGVADYVFGGIEIIDTEEDNESKIKSIK